MEWHNPQLESQAGDHKHQTEDENLMLDFTGIDGFEDFSHIQGARGAIHHGQTVQKETGCQGTQHKVLHGRLSRRCVVTAQGNQGVTRQRQQLQTQINHEEIVPRDHDEHTQQR